LTQPHEQKQRGTTRGGGGPNRATKASPLPLAAIGNVGATTGNS
jgi:hypothetical protein